MRATEIVNGRPIPQIVSEGGNAFPGVGSIYIDEVKPTLKSLADFLGMPEIVNQALGSAGKSEYSGDLDVVVDMDPETLKELSNDLRKKLGNQNVTNVAGNASFVWPISNYDKTKQGRKPRTGKVQVDLIPGEPEWYKIYYHSPGDASKLKGVHRNLGLAMVAKNMDREESKELDSFDRPVKEVRWMWGQKNGLTKVMKKSIKNEKTGKWLRKRETIQLTEPLKDPAGIAERMFKGKAGPEALNSLESIIDAVKKAYNKKQQEMIFSDMARAFEERGIYDFQTGFDVPKEIKPYLTK